MNKLLAALCAVLSTSAFFGGLWWAVASGYGSNILAGILFALAFIAVGVIVGTVYEAFYEFFRGL